MPSERDSAEYIVPRLPQGGALANASQNSGLFPSPTKDNSQGVEKIASQSAKRGWPMILVFPEFPQVISPALGMSGTPGLA
jgi:hypothetical protein